MRSSELEEFSPEDRRKVGREPIKTKAWAGWWLTQLVKCLLLKQLELMRKQTGDPCDWLASLASEQAPDQ